MSKLSFKYCPVCDENLESGKISLPAEYCEKCNRIFAEFEISDSNNPIGE